MLCRSLSFEFAVLFQESKVINVIDDERIDVVSRVTNGLSDST